MKQLGEACRLKSGTAFEIAIKNCIQAAQKGEKRRKVKISEHDSRVMYDFFRAHVKDSDEDALLAIANASRRAAGKSPVTSMFVFVVMLILVLITVFHNFWAPIGATLAVLLTMYLYWKRRRTAQKIWAARHTFKRDTEEALEKMCQVLVMSPFRTASLPLVGGTLAAILICVYQTAAQLLR